MSARVLRKVRDDQHGTITGYIYGCRCEPCRGARRAYRSENRVGDEALGRVYEALKHEADMDGLVTASSVRLGQLAGVNSSTAHLAVHALAERGRIEVVGRTAGRGGALLVQMAASA